MNIPSYVYQNGFGIYYFRIAIPKHLKAAIGKHEIRKSLKTTNYHFALKQARRFAVITEHMFQAGICDIRHINSAIQKSQGHPIDFFDGPVAGYSDNFGYQIEHDTLPIVIPFVSEQNQAITSIKLSDLIDRYVSCQDVENSWQEKTRATLKRLPPNMNKSQQYRNKSIKQILASSPKETLSHTSVNKYMRRISAMFNWAADRELLPKNYFRKKPIQEGKKANQKRDMLTSDEVL